MATNRVHSESLIIIPWKWALRQTSLLGLTIPTLLFALMQIDVFSSVGSLILAAGVIIVYVFMELLFAAVLKPRTVDGQSKDRKE